jgi:peroxiredoxin
LPSLEKLNNQFADKPFRIVLIDVGEAPQTVRSFVMRGKFTFPVLLDTDGKVSEKYHVLGHPVKFLLDKKGNLVLTAMGYRDWDSAEWIASFKRLLQKPGISAGK